MTTTYSNPKEMLGYLVVKFIERQLEVLQLIPYDRRAVFAYYYQIKGLDAQLVSFRSDMFLLTENDERVEYAEAMPSIEKKINENWGNVYGKDYDAFLKGVYAWSELIASSYPKLGLVPETGEINRAHKEDNVMEETNEYDNLPGEPIQDSIESKPEPAPSPPVQPDTGGKPARQRFRL